MRIRYSHVWGFVAAILAVASLAGLLTVGTASAYDYCLTIDGIVGQSTAPYCLGGIDVISYKHEIDRAMSSTSSGGGVGSGKIVFGELTVYKNIDIASPSIYKAITQGSHITRLTLEAYTEEALPGLFYVIELREIVVSEVSAQKYNEVGSSLEQGGDVAADEHIEAVSFSYNTVQWTVNQLDPVTGSVEATVSYGWDQKTQKPLSSSSQDDVED